MWDFTWQIVIFIKRDETFYKKKKNTLSNFKMKTLKISNDCFFFKLFDSDNKQLKKYIKIWAKVRNLLNIEFDSKPVDSDNDKYIKTK